MSDLGDHRVAVIIPAFNVEKYLRACLESLREQTYENWQAIVVDDGSTDSSLEVARSIAQEDPRVKVLACGHSGLAAARNAGIRACRGADFYAFIDADDVWLPYKLEIQMSRALQSGADLVFSHFHLLVNDATLPQQRRGDYWDHLIASKSMRALFDSCIFIPSGVLCTASLVAQVGQFDEHLGAAEDWDYWLRCLKAGANFYGISEPLWLYRKHDTNISSNQERLFWGNMNLVAKHHDLRDLAQSCRWFFRNTFTHFGDRGEFHRLPAMFERYLTVDREGRAARLMALLYRLLPMRAFWFLSRFVIIPLAWHLERFGQLLTQMRRPRHSRADKESTLV